tara:strand:- start:240 stop:1457 length:1218 start_codon:yes stop_codon:yes gene_type:complete
MKYKNNRYYIENISVDKICKIAGTPTYIYSYNKIKENILNFKRQFNSIDPLTCFSVKSNNNINILKIIKSFGLGADVVSMGELIRALKAGISPKKIVFSGVGKTKEELKFAIKNKILLINTESESELKMIEKIAKSMKKKIDIGLRLNPDTDAKTLSKISTGKKENKFGLNRRELLGIINNIKNSKYLNLLCLSVHIGSQITSHKPYEKMLKELSDTIKASKYKFEYIDLGGGMGIQYDKSEKALNYVKYLSLIRKFLKKHKCKIIFEPGRSIIGNTGYLASRVIYMKNSGKKNFVILDAAMNDFMRPALYGARHRILAAKKNNSKSNKIYEFVGPICETTDKFLTTSKFQVLNEGDVVLICDVGAYGIVLSSNYNLRTIPKEVLIKGSKIKIIKIRQSLKALNS